MKDKHIKASSSRGQRTDLQSFLDYSVMHYEDLGRVFSKALKKPSRSIPRK